VSLSTIPRTEDSSTSLSGNVQSILERILCGWCCDLPLDRKDQPAGDLNRIDDENMTTDNNCAGTTQVERTNANSFFDRTNTSQDNTVAAKMSDEPTNMKDESSSDDFQHAETRGRDPNTEGEDTLSGNHPKMTGTGVPGSHSAVFGLTPDGKTDTNTKSGATPVKPAHSKETSNTSSGDTGSRAGGGEGVSEQVNVF
jgi:hypothetical protein